MIAANLHGRTFEDVEILIHERAARVLPDQVVHLADLRMTTAGTIDVPGVGEVFPNDWAKKQLASLLGVRWDRWFAQASGDERAEETNRRLSRTPGERKVRTCRGDDGKPGTLRALLSPSFTPIDDVRIVDRLASTMRKALEEFVFSRVEIGDETTMLTAVHTESRDVRGDVHHPGFVLRNSEVGAASLSLDDYWFRLACQNGLLLQIGGKRALYRTHRAIEDDALQAALVVAMHKLPDRWRDGVTFMERALDAEVAHPDSEIAVILGREVPKPLIEQAQQEVLRDGVRTRFAVVQAITHIAHAANDSPAMRFRMEQLAGEYLAAA